jgi:hypothetical protein
MDRATLMDPWVLARIGSIYLFVGLIAGGIAYLGNTWGSKIGKKRLSIFGMRPRHTSNFITAVTGSLIAVTTLTLFAFFSEEVRGLLRGVDQLKAQLSQLKSEVQEVQKQLALSRLVWNVGEAITQGTLDPGLPAETQRLRILTQLDYANTCSVQQNNRIAREKREEPLEPDSQLLVWDESQLSHLAEQMVTEEKVVGVRIVAERNCLYKDKVPVKLELLPVSRIFREGEVVAAQTLQPDNPELLREWYAFLDAVRESALRRGMMEVNDSLGGGLTPEDFDRLIQELKRLHGPGKVSAVAKRDLYQTSRLAVRIQVEPARTSQRQPRLAARRSR